MLKHYLRRIQNYKAGQFGPSTWPWNISSILLSLVFFLFVYGSYLTRQVVLLALRPKEEDLCQISAIFFIYLLFRCFRRP